MERTTNLNLPQWEANDPIRRGDFNEAMAGLDTAIGNCKYVTGTYTGTGSDMTIEVGFRPAFLIIGGLKDYYDASTEEFARYCAITGGNTIQYRIEFTDTGFLIKTESSSEYMYPELTKRNRVYDYIAFR